MDVLTTTLSSSYPDTLEGWASELVACRLSMLYWTKDGSRAGASLHLKVFLLRMENTWGTTVKVQTWWVLQNLSPDKSVLQLRVCRTHVRNTSLCGTLQSHWRTNRIFYSTKLPLILIETKEVGQSLKTYGPCNIQRRLTLWVSDVTVCMLLKQILDNI